RDGCGPLALQNDFQGQHRDEVSGQVVSQRRLCAPWPCHSAGFGARHVAPWTPWTPWTLVACHGEWH
ncbi:unnamed protein product, partial [Cladocopium goreaui]